jgi:hypothetical protein
LDRSLAMEIWGQSKNSSPSFPGNPMSDEFLL